MFGKKTASEPRQPLPVKLITATHLIDGMLDPELNYPYIPVSEGTNGSWNPVALTGVTLNALSPSDVAPRSMPQFMARGDQIIALIPLVGIPISGYQYWKEFKKEMSGTFYFGPCIIRGTMHFLNPAMIDHVMPMSNMHIMPLTPEPAFTAMQVPFAVVNTRWMSGYEPTAP
jgi:hypothetical protein